MTTTQTDPPTLVAIAIAAHKTGDKSLERSARRLLAEDHQIRLQFIRTERKAVASG